MLGARFRKASLLQKCAHLQATIVEMQISQANATNELRHQMQQKGVV